ncbi:DUF1405 domain-containing protein [Listeria ilorinensis]|uniref:DUF1405 domain-containing protein n=1 Tax=Listeria ilorinensis TaxID=2867439 RepID=UPI001EF3EC0E|nr:DUF1405 domain-containing protein [Listeria ilorinensis]
MLYSLLSNRSFLRLLFVVNVLGAIYGYIWYIPQLQITAPRYWLFVPDSPTAILFFVFVLAAFLVKKHWPLMEALAFTCLMKYGIWAVGMNIALMIEEKTFLLAGAMLMVSHALMAVEGFLYAPFYRFRIEHFLIAAVWILHNDVIDYLFGQMPIYMGMEQYLSVIGYMTFWLSIFVLWIIYEKCIKKEHYTLEFPHSK